MTDLDLSSDLSAFEREFAPLALSDDAADLLFREARTAYAFASTPVTDAHLRAVHELSQWGPTAMNTQPLRVAYVRAPEARARLVPLMGGGNQQRTADAPMVAVLAADVDFHEELPRVFPVYPGARESMTDEAARERMAHTNAVLQAGYYLLAARAVGLVAGPMGGFDADAVSRELFPDGRHRAFLVVNLGFPAEDSYRPRQPRLGFDEVATLL